ASGMRLSGSCNCTGSILDRSTSAVRLAPFDTASSNSARAKPAEMVGLAMASAPRATGSHRRCLPVQSDIHARRAQAAVGLTLRNHEHGCPGLQYAAIDRSV